VDNIHNNNILDDWLAHHCYPRVMVLSSSVLHHLDNENVVESSIALLVVSTRLDNNTTTSRG
jgi:hypothetical protein